MTEKIRRALEATRKELTGLDEIANEDNVHKDYYAKLLQQIDEALKEPDIDIENLKDLAFHAGYNQRDHEASVAGTEYKDGYEDGFVRGKTITEQHNINTQPYEIYTKVGAETDSKGFVKPNAEVRITRRLEDADEISQLIHADLSRGVDECMQAINEVLKRAGGK